MLRAFSRPPLKVVLWIGGGMVVIVVLHIGGVFALRVGQFSPLTGALIGSSLALGSACFPRRSDEQTEPWIGFEQLSWMLIGLGMLLWAIGESFWRYFVAHGMAPFPSFADGGYSLFPLLAFSGLLLLPAPDARSRRMVLVMDSLISMGALFALAWYLLLGTLSQAPGEVSLAKFLGLYYPAGDTVLLSCIVFLLLRGQQGRVYQATARRMSLLVVGLGVCFFVASDFLFNIQQNAGTYVEATWVDLGWPLGMMTMGAAAYVRRFLPATPEAVIAQRMEQRFEQTASNPFQFVPYGLLGLLLIALTLNVLASDAGQQAIRPVLVFATFGVIGLVIVRQIMVLRDNTRLTERQAEALAHLAEAHQHLEQQSHQIEAYNIELERGIEHLCTVHAYLANGNLRARASLTGGPLLPLAGSLNLMAERLVRMGQANLYAQRLLAALGDLSVAFEQQRQGTAFLIPPSCQQYTEIQRLLVAMGMQSVTSLPMMRQSSSPAHPLAAVSPLRASASFTSQSSPASTLPPVTAQLPPRGTPSVSPPAQHAQPYGTQQRVPGMRPSPPLGAWGPSSAQERK